MIFKTLQFLLLYIRYDTDSNYGRVRDQNDHMVLNYLSTTSVRFRTPFHAGRFHSHAGRRACVAALPVEPQSLRLPFLLTARFTVVHTLGNRFVKEGYLLGIAFVGFKSPALSQLLQVAEIRLFSPELREPHRRRPDGVDAVARRQRGVSLERALDPQVAAVEAGDL